MSTPESIVAAQLNALLELIEKRHDEQCGEILTRMETERGDLLAAARKEARRRLHQAVEEERARARREIEQARARLHTQRRASSQRAALEALREGYPRLEAAVAARWSEPGGRKPWIDELVRHASNVLPRSQWEVAFVPVPGADVAGEIRASIASWAHHDSLRLREDDEMRAGLCIGAEGAFADATLGSPDRGLFAHREAVEAALMAELRRLLETERP